MQNDDLPQEVILAVQRVLETAPIENALNSADILNDFFPDGALVVSGCLVRSHRELSEASLAHIESVNHKLNETRGKLQREIDELQEELKKNQGPERMSLIQEMISVS
jgi:hypothetical protein